MKYLILLSTICLMSCVSTRSLNKAFSDTPLSIENNFGEYKFYNNKPVQSAPTNLAPTTDSKLFESTPSTSKVLLWNMLSSYRKSIDSILEIPQHAVIKLELIKNKILKVSAYDSDNLLESFTIPVKNKKSYLILENKTKVIPIPIIYFEVKERKSILSLLKNGNLGISSYNGDSLWILFMAASNDSKSVIEFSPHYKN